MISRQGYVHMLWALSIGIMLDIETEVFDKLVDLVPNLATISFSLALGAGQLGGGAGGDDGPGDEVEAVALGAGGHEVVRGHEHGAALLGEVAEQVPEHLQRDRKSVV